MEERTTAESPVQDPRQQTGPFLVRYPARTASGAVRVQLRVLVVMTAVWACLSVGKAGVAAKARPGHGEIHANRQMAFAAHRVIEWRSVKDGVVAATPVALLQETWSDAGIDVVVEPVISSGH